MRFAKFTSFPHFIHIIFIFVSHFGPRDVNSNPKPIFLSYSWSYFINIIFRFLYMLGLGPLSIPQCLKNKLLVRATQHIGTHGLLPQLATSRNRLLQVATDRHGLHRLLQPATTRHSPPGFQAPQSLVFGSSKPKSMKLGLSQSLNGSLGLHLLGSLY